MAEVGRLLVAVGIVEEESDGVGGVERLGEPLPDRLLVRDEADIGIGVAQERDDQAGHRAGQPAAMLLPEACGIGKPREDVAEGADRKLHQHVAAARVVFVFEHDRIISSHLDPEAYEVALRAHEAAGPDLALEQDVAGIQVAQPCLPPAVGQRHPCSQVEIETDTEWSALGRDAGRRRIGRLGGLVGCRRIPGRMRIPPALGRHRGLFRGRPRTRRIVVHHRMRFMEAFDAGGCRPANHAADVRYNRSDTIMLSFEYNYLAVITGMIDR